MKEELSEIIGLALEEDGALDDVTSDLTVDENHEISFEIAPREDIILCGIEAVEICFGILQSVAKFEGKALGLEFLAKDGDLLRGGNAIVRGRGNAKLIFAGERVILNLIQHLSGVATLTYSFRQELGDDNIKILDTRKTSLGMRALEKYAVLQGGGGNHRFNLSDMILIKDNHIAACGGIREAVVRAKDNGRGLKVEVECDNLDQVADVLDLRPDVIMLDNMGIEEVVKAKEIIGDICKVEVSGGVDLGNVAKYRGSGVDFISVGALTHSVRAVDLGLDVI